MNTQHRILMGQSISKKPRTAVRELHAAIAMPDMALVIFFCSSHYDLFAIASEMNTLFPDVLVVGCTTAGEIGTAGSLHYSLSGVSFSTHGFTAVAGHHDILQEFNRENGKEFANDLLQQLEEKKSNTGPENTFGFMLIDGISKREEPVVSAFQNALGNIGLFGGSASDDQEFKTTWVFCNGAFHTDSVVLILINTIYPFKLFKAQHFISGQEKLVVTKADASRRVIYEINGLPAAEEYARHVGVKVSDLSTTQFAAYPLVVRINGMDYVRSIQSANADGSMLFYCAIDTGIVFRIAQGVDLITNLKETFDSIHSEIGQPQVVIACDCLLRNLEIARTHLKEPVEEIFKKNNVVGFHTFGEQFMGVHINQTITGLAIGELGKKDHD
ncbi:MAG: nitric oxide-sensing protein NosP [Gammaproteobacteria bacterium]|nr:nitric oxide-sensing protein NosP [Gammaproteobacteria bacterium]